jgi:hypothetical protein
VEKEGGAGGGEEGAGGGKGNGNKQVKKEVGVEEVTTKKTGKGKKRVNEEEKAEQAGVGQEGREAATTTTIPKWATKKLKTEEDAGKNMRATKKTMTARRSSPRGGSGEAGGVKTKGKGAKKGK